MSALSPKIAFSLRDYKSNFSQAASDPEIIYIQAGFISILFFKNFQYIFLTTVYDLAGAR